MASIGKLLKTEVMFNLFVLSIFIGMFSCEKEPTTPKDDPLPEKKIVTWKWEANTGTFSNEFPNDPILYKDWVITSYADRKSVV